MATHLLYQHHRGPYTHLLPKTPLQLQTLEILYSDDKNPTQSRLEDYALGLGLTYEQAKRWFVERRKRDLRVAASVPGVNEFVKSSSKGKSQLKKTLSNLEEREHENCTRRAYVVQDMLYSPDYIFKKIFRKDGPPLGADFDPLPDTAFQDRNKIADSRCCEVVYQSDQRAPKRRKVTKPAILDAERCTQVETPVKKHGKGKGLMSVWQLVNSHASSREASGPGVLKRGKVTRHGMGKGFMNASELADHNFKRTKRRKPTILRRSKGKARDKNKLRAQQRKVESSRNRGEKAHRDCCKIALDLVSCGKSFCSSPALADDEELELKELQAGPNPLTCGSHVASSGSHGCSLCKGLLPKFPPDSVKMKKPLFPWNSLEHEKNFFKVFHFLYTYGVVLDLCPFTLDEFAMAFHDKDSLLMGKLHVSLLGVLLSDIQKEISDGLSCHSNKNGRFLSLLHKAETPNLVKFWEKSLNPLTWSEILRQVVVAAGFGSKDDIQIKGCPTKEADHITKHGLHPGTLKGELFSILFEQGNKGMKISELSKSSKIVDLIPGQTNGELEDSICSILAGDITLFEKISSSAYRIRLRSIMRKDDEALSEDSGSIDDDSRFSSNIECDSSNSSSRLDTRYQSPENNPLSLSSIIDESHPGESWFLGLMEGEYSDLSIGEKLNAFLALVDLVSAGASIRLEDPSSAVAECVPRIYQYGSGGKIKRSATRQPSLLTSSYNDRDNLGVENRHQFSEIDPVDSSVVLSMMSEERNYSGSKKRSNGVVYGGYLHPIQSIFLGSDRRYNRYWLFLGPCNGFDPGHKQIYFESSEDGLWQVIDSEEALCGLLAALNGQGRREANLLASLEKRMPFLLEELSSWVSVDASVSPSTQSGLSEVDRFSEDSPSPISDMDNLSLSKTLCNVVESSGLVPFKAEKKVEVQKQKYERLQAFDSWIWDGFYLNLHSVKQGKLSFFDSWTRCGSCHDLYWRDERHCKICHTTFELDLDLEEKYTIHLASCQGPEEGDVYPVHKVLPSKLQALKAAVHVIELIMPEDAMIGAWKKSAYKLWVRRLKRTSSLHELLQVVADFVGSFNVDWVSQCNITLKHESPIEDFVAHFQNMPQSLSAVALWLVILDSLIGLQLDGVLGGTAKGQEPTALRVISVDEHRVTNNRDDR